jgi:hypothetical protein
MLSGATLAVASPAFGAPQANVGLTIGGAATDLRTSASSAFHLGGRADVLFLRERGRDMAVGPYVEVLSEGFRTLELGGGVEWLLPVREELPLVLSAGSYARRAPSFAWEPGVAAGVFFGARSFNFHSIYGLAAGLFVQGRYGLGDAHQADVVMGLQMDVVLLAYPAIFLYEAIAH